MEEILLVTTAHCPKCKEAIAKLEAAGVDYDAMLENNDSYHALKAIGNLVITGPTGTNVNDVTIGLIGG